YRATNPTLTYTPTGFVNGDTSSVLSGTTSLSTTAVTNSSVGSYPITITVGTLSAADYSFSFVNGSLTVTKATPVINWSNPAD
ncbi:MBG domain-containing protein, partial [Ciceribacter ferrooxidans]|uniref:MBG domain-containing protein n=1 Tax=Ciceribacter ferrooxidans TaxID=2509717 RepID=UPI0013E9EF6B